MDESLCESQAQGRPAYAGGGTVPRQGLGILESLELPGIPCPSSIYLLLLMLCSI